MNEVRSLFFYSCDLIKKAARNGPEIVGSAFVWCDEGSIGFDGISYRAQE